MTRLFKRHYKRNTFELDGMWSFKADKNRVGFEERWFDTFPQESEKMIVPSCWNNEMNYYDYEGLAWYAKTFTTNAQNIQMIFHAVTGQAEVYFDGKHVGSHYGGFTEFSFNIVGLEAGEHTVTVAVDNTHDNMNTIPLSYVDWFHYGGIIRPVEVMELQECWINDCRIDYEMGFEKRDAKLKIALKFDSTYQDEKPTNLNIYINDLLISSRSINVTKGANIKIDNIYLKDVKLWDINKPNLYNIRIEIDEDDIVERIGFRTIECKDRKIYLNGREIFIKGVNRHEDHPDWGFAFPLKLMKKDIDIIKDMGCNSIRGSHYPNSEIFLDYCDQEGILFWGEIPMWGFGEEPLKNPLIVNRGLTMIEEMVIRDYHHPCIIFWGMHNEIETRSQAAYDITKVFAEKARSLDKSRLITYATMHPMEDICFPLVDVISVNKYYGWYYDEIEEWASFLKKFKEHLDSKNWNNMPIIISEFGAAALYGESTFESPKWTENFQAKYLDYTLRLFSEDSDISGTYIWQFCDIRSAKEMEMSRARSFNNKGILNEYRKPKLAYWNVKDIYGNIER